MDWRSWASSPYVIMLLGVGLFLLALAHHIQELFALNNSIGPAIALVLDGVPALGLLYGGYRLDQSEFSHENKLRVVIWSLGGSLIFLSVMGTTFFVRSIEGRVVTEPIFVLLVTAEAGAIAGLIAGYYNARARADATRAETVSDALAFVNDLIRHDLRNDLNVIDLHADLIENNQSEANTTGGDPAVIIDKTDEALSRIETSRAITETLVGDPDLKPVDITAITVEVANQLEATHDVTVRTDLPDKALVTANAGLWSVVDNLLENAAEHNDADDPKITVAVEVAEDTVRLSVSDNGPGIPDEEKTTLFSEKGGLSLVHTLVESYGGTIRIEDNEPQGSRFIVEQPQVERRF